MILTVTDASGTNFYRIPFSLGILLGLRYNKTEAQQINITENSVYYFDFYGRVHGLRWSIIKCKVCKQYEDQHFLPRRHNNICQSCLQKLKNSFSKK